LIFKDGLPILKGMSKEHKTSESFKYAFDGLKLTTINEPNFRIQIVLAIASTFLGIALKISQTEWLILIIAIFMVLLLELINSSLEALVDLVSPDINEKAKVAKDTAAAAVLTASILSLIIGIVIFLPKILILLK
jgi:diacylglycerol kinase